MSYWHLNMWDFIYECRQFVSKSKETGSPLTKVKNISRVKSVEVHSLWTKTCKRLTYLNDVIRLSMLAKLLLEETLTLWLFLELKIVTFHNLIFYSQE